METKFSVAIHILAMVSETEEKLSSKYIAESVGTNPSFVRKIIVLLKKSGIIDSSQGKAGYRLSQDKNSITLYEIYCSVNENTKVELFHIHQTSNKKCPVGRYIKGAIDPFFSRAEIQLKNELSSATLGEVIEKMYSLAGKDSKIKGEGKL